MMEGDADLIDFDVLNRLYIAETEPERSFHDSKTCATIP
jgi:hypothetical protein